MTIEKIEGYLPYRGVVGDLLDKVNELVDAVNALAEHTHLTNEGDTISGTPREPLDNR